RNEAICEPPEALKTSCFGLGGSPCANAARGNTAAAATVASTSRLVRMVRSAKNSGTRPKCDADRSAMQRITARAAHGGCAPCERRRKPVGGLAKPPFLVAEKPGKPLASKRPEWNNLPIPVGGR